VRHVVIMSSYNRPSMVARAIESVLSQEGEWFLIVADDGSDKATKLSILRAFGYDSRCLLMPPPLPREGPHAVTDPTVRAVACINAALAHVDWTSSTDPTQDLLHYLPDDDWYAPGRFVAFERWFQAHPQHSVAYGRLNYTDGLRVTGTLWRGNVLSEPACQVDHGAVAHRRSCLKAVTRWPSEPGDFAFDAAFFTALAHAGYLFYPIPELVSFKLQHSKNLQAVGFADVGSRE